MNSLSSCIGITENGLIFMWYTFSRFSWRVQSTYSTHEIAICCMNNEKIS